MTDEQKAKISVALMGRTASLETRAKQSAAAMGRIMSPETRAKQSARQIGRILSPEWRASISIAHMGHTASPETRAKMSIRMTGSTGSLCRCWKGGKQVTNRKKKAKRRLLGFNPLNSPFIGCQGHHINPQDVIYIPEKIHQSIRHNIRTGKNMDKMNALAGQFLTEDWT